jgi:hypothetical protein
VRRRLYRVNTEGIDGLGGRSGPGRRPRVTQAERSAIIGLVKTIPLGKATWDSGGMSAAVPKDRRCGR